MFSGRFYPADPAVAGVVLRPSRGGDAAFRRVSAPAALEGTRALNTKAGRRRRLCARVRARGDGSGGWMAGSVVGAEGTAVRRGGSWECWLCAGTELGLAGAGQGCRVLTKLVFIQLRAPTLSYSCVPGIPKHR